MRSSLRVRLLLSFAFVIVAMALIIGGTMLVYVARGNLVSRLRLQAVAGQLSQRQNIPILDFEATQQVLERIDDTIGMRVLVINSDGVVEVDTRAEQSPEFPEFVRFPRDFRRDIFQINDLDGNRWLYTGRPVTNEFTLIIAVQRQPLREVIGSPITTELLQALLISGAVAAGLSMLLAVGITRSVASPLQKISQAAHQIAEGEAIKVELEGPREVRELGATFNEMAGKLHAGQISQRDFIANVSHELKTPLTSVQGFSQAILDGTASSSVDRQQAAKVIYDEAGRMHRMVLDLLDLAKLDAGTAEFKRERLELAVLLQQLVERFMPQSWGAQVDLVAQIDSLPVMIGDGDWLVQVFTNLVDNAFKHTPPGGRITLIAREIDGYAEVSIEDTGAGIPQEELSRIFERFYQMDKSRKGGPQHGAGLGLAIAKEIVEAHGGSMTAASREGEGSSFTVRLPFAKPDDETLEIPRPS
jgi:signal transduction histidine kinase